MLKQATGQASSVYLFDNLLVHRTALLNTHQRTGCICPFTKLVNN